jgi:hypothetical protein
VDELKTFVLSEIKFHRTINKSNHDFGLASLEGLSLHSIMHDGTFMYELE